MFVAPPANFRLYGGDLKGGENQSRCRNTIFVISFKELAKLDGACRPFDKTDSVHIRGKRGDSGENI
jgi:hypothetical protein